MEMIYVVNDQDVIIGVKDRSQITPTDTYRISVLWLTDSDGNILLAQRSMSKAVNPGMWGPAVVGTATAGETYETNIIKEAGEEIGLMTITPILGPKWRLTEPTFDLFAQWFTYQVDANLNDFVLQESEVSAVKWLSRSELLGLLSDSPDDYVPAVTWALKNI